MSNNDITNGIPNGQNGASYRPDPSGQPPIQRAPYSPGTDQGEPYAPYWVPEEEREAYMRARYGKQAGSATTASATHVAQASRAAPAEQPR